MLHRRALGTSARRGLVLQMFRGLSVCLSDTFVSPAKTDEPIDAVWVDLYGSREPRVRWGLGFPTFGNIVYFVPGGRYTPSDSEEGSTRRCGLLVTVTIATGTIGWHSQ